MPAIHLKLAQNSYKIFIAQNLSNDIPKKLKAMKLGNRYAIITDSKVKKLYGNALLRFLKKNDLQGDIFDFPFGERSKNLKTIETLAQKMITKGFDRTDAIIALGGGVTGDIAGFLASIYMRGIPYIQIPTTLLAMVDSSVGGKTGVNLEKGKNLLGTFTQPSAVFIDPSYLETLAQKQIKNGLAEIIKYGIIKDKSLFNFIEQNLKQILSLTPGPTLKIIEKSVKIKAQIVEKDEKEQNLRMILNYEHSFGHLIEKNSGYKLLHGFAISIGMVLANKHAVQKGILNKKDADKIKNLLKNAGLPITTLKKPQIKDLKSDKKKTQDRINLILPKKIGQVVIHKEKCL